MIQEGWKIHILEERGKVGRLENAIEKLNPRDGHLKSNFYLKNGWKIEWLKFPLFKCVRFDHFFKRRFRSAKYKINEKEKKNNPIMNIL